MQQVIDVEQEKIEQFFNRNGVYLESSVMEVLQKMIQFIQEIGGKISTLFNDVWNIDLRMDAVQYFSIKQMTRADIDRVKNIKIQQIQDNIEILKPYINATGDKDKLIIGMPRSIFNVQYEKDNNEFGQYNENIQQARNIQMLFRYLFSDQDNQIMDGTLRQELKLFSEGFDQVQQVQPQSQSITVSNMLQYAQICDFDFVKACVIISIIRYIMFHRNHIQFCQQIDNNVIYIAIKISQYMNSRLGILNKNETAALAQDANKQLSQSEYDLFQQKQGTQHSFFLDHVVTSKRLTYVFRPQFGKIYDVPFILNREILVRGNLNDRQQESLSSIMQQFKGDLSYRVSGIYGNVIDIIAQRILFQLRAYTNNPEIMKSKVMLYISIVFQVPQGVLTHEFLTQNQSEQNEKLMRDYNFSITRIEQLVLNNNMDDAMKFIQQSQIEDVQGLSQYYTINLQIQDFVSNITNLQYIRHTKNQLSKGMQSKIEQLVSEYGQTEDKDIRVGPILACMQDAVIRKMSIRPFFLLQKNVQMNNEQRQIIEEKDLAVQKPARQMIEHLNKHISNVNKQQTDAMILIDIFNNDMNTVTNIIENQDNITDEQIDAMNNTQKSYLSYKTMQRYKQYVSSKQYVANIMDLFNDQSQQVKDKISRYDWEFSDEELLGMSEQQINALPAEVQFRRVYIDDEIKEKQRMIDLFKDQPQHIQDMIYNNNWQFTEEQLLYFSQRQLESLGLDMEEIQNNKREREERLRYLDENESLMTKYANVHKKQKKDFFMDEDYEFDPLDFIDKKDNEDNEDFDVDKQFNGIYSKIDADMHKLYGYDSDMYGDCVKCTNNRLNNEYQNRYNVEDIVEFRNIIEQNPDMQIQLILYSTNGLMSEIQMDRRMLIFIGMNHIFAGDYKKIRELSALKQHEKIQENMSMYRVQNMERRCMQSLIINKDFISQGIFFAQRCRANVYFDFETTFDDITPRYINTGFKGEKAYSIRDQIDFAVSIVIDVKLDLERVLNGMRYDLGLQPISASRINLRIDRTLSLWHIPASERLLDILNAINQDINEAIHEFNFMKKNLSNCDTVNIYNTIRCYSFNGSKFDNHFVLSQIKQIEGNHWIDHVNIIGTQADMKCMIYRDYHFLDIRLMTGASSLKQFCKDMQINQEDAKKEIDMSKMRTLSLCQENRDEIMQYVENDSVAIFKIHKKFMKSVRRIVANYAQHHIETSMIKPFNAHIPDILRDKLENCAQADILYRYLKGAFANWTTISSLSRKIFTDYFCKYNIFSPKDQQVFDIMSKSYQGGYTQAFWMGEQQQGDNIVYLDYNSMYPAIMSNMHVPCNLSRTFIQNVNDKEMNRNNAAKDFELYIDRDCFHKSRGIYIMHECSRNYSLYELSEFAFNENTFAPQFGLRTRISGTIYPLTYDVRRDSDIADMPIVFGFQLAQAFRLGILKYAKIRRCMHFERGIQYGSIFKTFDEYMYNSRLQYKAQNNASMAQCIKLFINSLYGKFGEKHHDINIRMSRDEYADDAQFQQRIKKCLDDHRGVVQDYQDRMEQIQVKASTLFDLNNRDTNIMQINISNIPMVNNHIGSFVYYASMITAIGRCQLTNIINRVSRDADCRVYYADTDSLIMNKQAAKLSTLYVNIDGQVLGDMKNEYPAANSRDKLSTTIEKLIVINKKIYQYRINGEWHNKFKGCRDPRDDMFEDFKSGTGKYSQKQTRFKKRNGNVTIVDMNMEFKLRLSRQITQAGLNVQTSPFNDVYSHNVIYKDTKTQVVFSQYKNQWVIHTE